MCVSCERAERTVLDHDFVLSELCVPAALRPQLRQSPQLAAGSQSGRTSQHRRHSSGGLSYATDLASCCVLLASPVA